MSDLKIMIVDDDTFLLEYTTLILQNSGYTVLPVSKYEDAIQSASSFSPDVVLLDINLDDGKTGYQLSHELRADSKLRNIPIVFITSDTSNTSNTQCKVFVCGALDFIHKPFTQEDITTRLAPIASIGRLTKLLTEIGNK